MIRVGIYGATGYTGFELLKIFERHSQVRIAFASSESNAGKRYCEVYPCPYQQVLVAPEKAPLDQVDVVFLCTPHHASAPLARSVLDAGARCIDLSADLRLRDVAIYEAWYGQHPAPELLAQAVYGLTEVYRPQIAGACLIANPGCYPTGPLLALRPFLQSGRVSGDHLIIDAASGVSGAGAQPTPKSHFVTVHDNYSAYNVGHTHRHVPEIEQELSLFAGRPMRITFSPHLLPVSRGILSTVYVRADPTCDAQHLLASWLEAYRDEHFVQVLPLGELATLAHVVNTNRVVLSLATGGVPGEFIVVTAIDNLIKGASGQAVQNMNVMFGLSETLGLE